MITLIAPPRGTDSHGNGAYGARRKNRKHQGYDLAAWPKTIVLAGVSGKISKIGYPYLPDDTPKGRLRYIEITTTLTYKVRYFYVQPSVVLGEIVQLNQPIGAVQDLMAVYGWDMTPHIHLEVIGPNGKHMDPKRYFEAPLPGESPT